MESISADATKSNFLEQSNSFIQHVPNASFIAIDEEMTGIMLPAGMGKPITKDETPAERYTNLKLVPERYAIIQLGICLFERTGAYESDSVDRASFSVRRYKFTLFPQGDSREVVLNPSSIHFLQQNNMNLDLWAREGIPFCTQDVATNLLDKFHSDQLKKNASKSTSKASYNRGGKVELTRVEDKDFHARAMASLREWLDSAIVPDEGSSEGASFLLLPCNAFLRRALYESIPFEYPNLVLETFEGTQIRVWRMNATERRRRDQRLLREGYENLLKEKIGVWRIFLALSKACRGEQPTTQAEKMALALNVEEAMTPLGEDAHSPPKRKIPLIVHNGLQDLLFMLTHFVTPTLPQKWENCKELIHTHFPIVYDTKTMASEYCSRGYSRNHTHLAAVYQQAISRYPRWNASTADQDELQEQEHDAAYDAYMTGVAFCGLSYTINEQIDQLGDVPRSQFELWNCTDDDESPTDFYGKNKLHFHISPYTIDLATSKPDPMRRGMSRTSTFRVTGIDPTVSTRDIVRCLKGLVDAEGDRVNFEIIWVDNTTFLVGVMIEDHERYSNFHDHSAVLFNALRGRFQRETICSLEPENTTKAVPGFWNLWGLLGRKTTDEGARPNKKRRLE